MYRSFFRLLLALATITVAGTGPAHADAALIKRTWVAGFQAMTAQLIGVQVHMTGAIGGFIDGANLAAYQTMMQRLHAEAIADYTPGENLCRLGTLSRSLAASEGASDATAMALQTMMQDRETHTNWRVRPFAGQDDLSRLRTLASLYCNPGDNGAEVPACFCDLKAGTCSAASGPLGQRSNRDLDFARAFDSRLTMKINFTDGVLSADEQDLLAFLSTMTAYRPFPALSPKETMSEASPIASKTLMDMRNVIATRGIIRSTLARQMAAKASGAGGVSPFALNILKEMGMSDAEAKRYLESEGIPLARGGGDAGEDVFPSYNAQMEILTKKIYQNPNFYVNLVDKPANVARTQGALAAISLMQRRDMKESLDRREILLSQMLEYAIRDYELAANARMQKAISQ